MTPVEEEQSKKNALVWIDDIISVNILFWRDVKAQRKELIYSVLHVIFLIFFLLN